jgi:hypothetical protein
MTKKHPPKDKSFVAAGGFKCIETVRQDYTNCSFSAGIVTNHPTSSVYMRFDPVGVEAQEAQYIFLRDDEALAMAWCLIGACWTRAMENLPPEVL